MLERFGRLVGGLVVRPERMTENIERGLGLHASSRLLTMLIQAGMTRGDAYALVQRDALRAADERTAFRDLVEADVEVTGTLSAEALERCFDDRAWLTHVDEVMARLERLDP
jgi:adenylosuccinate lyase